MVELKSTHEPIVDIEAVNVSKKDNLVEMGDCYGSSYWNKGYATEALKAFIDYMFSEVEVDKVIACHISTNPASGRVMEKAGMHLDASLKGYFIDKNTGKRAHKVCYSIDREPKAILSEGAKGPKLDGFGIMVKDMPKMVRFYRDVLHFDIKEDENAENVYLIKDGTLFMLYRRKDFEKMLLKEFEYVKELNGQNEFALYVDRFTDVDKSYEDAISNGATSVLPPTTEPWGQRTCYIADPEGNLIEIGSFNKPFAR